MTRKSSYPALYAFLKEKEQLKTSFTLKDLAQFAGVKDNTVSKYFSEKLYKYIHETNGKYESIGLSNMTYEDFERIICQRNPDNK